MTNPKKTKKRKGKIKLSQKARIVKKDSVKKAPTKTIITDNGVTFMVRIRKKQNERSI